MRNFIAMLSLLLSVNCFAKVKVPVTATSTAVDQIAKYFGDSSYYHLKTNKLNSMLNEYLWDNYEDEQLLSSYNVVLDQDNIETNTNTVGTLKSNVVLSAITNALIQNESIKGEALVQATAVIANNLKILANEGVIFGFDGNEHNTCGAPSNYLLVIDTKNSNIFGLNLNPCNDK